MNNGRSRGFCWTWNNYPDDCHATLAVIECTYICYGEEVAPGTGTRHLQGYVRFGSLKSHAQVRVLFPGCHIQIARGSIEQNRDYCRKDGRFYERGDVPTPSNRNGEVERSRWEDAWAAAKAGRIEDVPADIRVRYYSALRKIERDYMPRVDNLQSVCGLWIWGESGAGKSYAVHQQVPELFVKPRNIWWDGYQNEANVLVDDIDIFDVKLGGLLKHWADAYAFVGECKGGSKRIRPKRVIVTSQYKIEEIWKDKETQDALLRRFTVVNKIREQNIII